MARRLRPIAFSLSVAAHGARARSCAAYAALRQPRPVPVATRGLQHQHRSLRDGRFGLDRHGLLPRANLNLGIGHTLASLKKDPLGDELTVAYTYENAGSHGFFHTPFGEHTEQFGLMKNFALPGTRLLTGYTWLQSGLTTYTGHGHALNRMASAASLGAIVHLSGRNSIWLQESSNKVNTVPWYTTSSIGYTFSW
jgi:hypothetical protein